MLNKFSLRQGTWLLFLWLLATQAVWGQLPAPVRGERPSFMLTGANAHAFRPGLLAIKLANPAPTGGELLAGRVGIPAVDAVLEKFGVTSASPLFAACWQQALQNENSYALAQMENWGLTAWYSLRFSTSQPLHVLAQALLALPQVAAAEPIAPITLHSLPNDEHFARQWYLHNTGQAGGRTGTDIGMADAWNIETGKPEVLVSVHDGGLQTDHPDLAANMWFGKGYNFVTNSPVLTPDAHGTHVAGIVGAVRNNGIGIAGVAGGSGQAGSGVRLMSMQIIGGVSQEAGYEANSFVFAANNGACISQNSWSYSVPDFFPQFTADAIDYFIENAGGGQLGGGLVVFSAGNYGTSQLYYPAPYSRVLAVAATGPADEKGPYSSFGPWVDICAPGGNNQQPAGQDATIYSTITGSSYGYLQGTSMAAPQVSGVAALLASHLPGRLLADDVRDVLQRTAQPIEIFNSPSLAGQLGSGRLQAASALQWAAAYKALPIVAAPAQVSLTPLCDSVRVSWALPPGGQQVVVATSLQPTVGFPEGSVWAVGQSLPGGGQIVYRGTGSQHTLALPIDGSTLYLRVWMADASGTHYSKGISLQYEVPNTIQNLQYQGGQQNILLSWQRACPARQVLLLYSPDGLFGTPSGNPATITTLPAGGTRLAHGAIEQYNHTGLQTDHPYYYALYAYREVDGGWEYGQRILLPASTACATATGQVQESFTQEAFPSPGWRLYDGGPAGSLQPDFKTWRRVELPGSRPGDDVCLVLNAYTQNGGNSKEVLRAPAVLFPPEADSLVLSFDYAYKAYSESPALADSLEIAWTADCGASYHTLWKRGGTGLNTVPGTSTSEFVPTLEQWKAMQFSLKDSTLKGRSINFAFIGTNKFGQNVWLDNISISAAISLFTDGAVVAITSPAAPYECANTVNLSLLVGNRGNGVLDSLTLTTELNNQPLGSQLIRLRQLLPGRDTLLAVGSLTLQTGPNTLVLYSSMPNGLPDVNSANDTLRQTIYRAGQAGLPQVLGFEALNLPTDWLTLGAAAASPWQVSRQAAWQGVGALQLPVQPAGRVASFASPILSLPADADSLFISFAAAAARLVANPLTDTLQLLATSNCGQTFTLLASLSGNALVLNNTASSGGFVPTQNGQWAPHRVDATALYKSLPAGATLQVLWRWHSAGVSTLWLDEVKIETVTLPAALRQQGVAAYPNPFRQSFTLWHLHPPTTLQAASLVNALGQQLMQWQWQPGTAPRVMQLDTRRLPAGWYTLVLYYTDGRKSFRLLKQ